MLLLVPVKSDQADHEYRGLVAVRIAIPLPGDTTVIKPPLGRPYLGIKPSRYYALGLGMPRNRVQTVIVLDIKPK